MTIFGYGATMLRRLALSYWTPIGLGVVLLGLHFVWGKWLEPTKRGEVVTGFGACLIVLGLLVAARPLIGSGLVGAAEQAAPIARAAIISGGRINDPELMARRARARSDIAAERIVAVLVIAIGTLLNGYGSPLVRWFGLEG